MVRYVAPSHTLDAFNCPHCEAYAQQRWFDGMGRNQKTKASEFFDGLLMNRCTLCERLSFWYNSKMVYPLSSDAPLATDDMPQDVKDDFTEARSIANFSPRAAAALLRLALQKLTPDLGENGKDLNEDIASLVKKGLPKKIQQALDAIRVIGNNAVHPGQIDIKDDKQTAVTPFELLNVIVDVMITQPKRIEKTYEVLPESTRKAIEERDKNPDKSVNQ